MPSVSNKDIKQFAGTFQAWWDTKSEAEKAWYFRFWAHCQRHG